MRLYSFRLTAAVSPFMAYNRRHRAAISVSLSAAVRWDGGGIFFSQLIIYRCLFIVPRRVLFIWDWEGVARSQRGRVRRVWQGSSGTLSVTSPSSLLAMAAECIA